MSQLNAQQVSINGSNVTFAAVTASDTVTPDDRVFLNVRNASGSTDTVTVITPGFGPGGIAVPDIPITVPAGGERWIGPLNAALADPVTGLVTVTHSVTASVTCALVRN